MQKRCREKTWDRERLEPAIRKSICTGEETFGFVRRADGSFMDICLLRDDREKDAVLSEYGIRKEDVRLIY